MILVAFILIAGVSAKLDRCNCHFNWWLSQQECPNNGKLKTDTQDFLTLPLTVKPDSCSTIPKDALVLNAGSVYFSENCTSWSMFDSHDCSPPAKFPPVNVRTCITPSANDTSVSVTCDEVDLAPQGGCFCHMKGWTDKTCGEEKENSFIGSMLGPLTHGCQVFTSPVDSGGGSEEEDGYAVLLAKDCSKLAIYNSLDCSGIPLPDVPADNSCIDFGRGSWATLDCYPGLKRRSGALLACTPHLSLLLGAVAVFYLFNQ